MSSSKTTNGQPGIDKIREPPKRRSRGNYWEVTYKQDIVPFESWTLQTAADLGTEPLKTNAQVVTSTHGARAVNLKNKGFETCDFNHFTLNDSSFNHCTFVDCRFVKSNFNHVKFSNCHFDTCHFLNVRFENCQFLDCEFTNISASAEQLHFISSSLLAGHFVDALVTNLAALPQDTDASYQLYRLRRTKAKIAGRILIAVRDEPEPDILARANRTFEIALQCRQIAEARWIDNGRRLIRQTYFNRFLVFPLRRAGLEIMRMSGYFTDWGSSPMKSGWFLLGALVIFTAIYCLGFKQNFSSAAVRALDCTFVIGYSNYPHGPNIKALDWAMFVNAFVGLWWYGLFVPALTKRLFR